MTAELQRLMENAIEVVNEVELIRGQIEELKPRVKDAATGKAADELNQNLINVEEELLTVRATGPGSTSGGAPELLSKINDLARQVGSADFKPTNPQLEVQKLLEARLRTIQGQLDALRTRDLTALNERLKNENLPQIRPSDRSRR